MPETVWVRDFHILPHGTKHISTVSVNSWLSEMKKIVVDIKTARKKKKVDFRCKLF